MTLLNQIVAVEATVRSNADKSVNDAYHTIQKDVLFGGIERVYKPRDDEGEQLPPESTRVQHTADELINQVTKAWTRLFDVTLTKDAANTEAKADVKLIVAGQQQTLIADVPVPYLLFLEKRLLDLRAFVSKLPLLDPAERWSHDANSGVWASDPAYTTKTKKINRPMVLAQATEQHPAQVQVVTEDVMVGTWTTIKFAGRIARDRQTELLDRIEALLESVKVAREEANSHVVTERKVGAEVFAFLFGPASVPTPAPVTSPVLPEERAPQTPA